MNKPTLTIVALVSMLSLSACTTDVQDNAEDSVKRSIKEATNTENMDKPKLKESMMTLRGTIVYQNFEGGFFSFIADDGSQYTPQTLAPEHRRDGLVVQITGEIVTDMMTTTQFGQLLKVHNLTVLDASKTLPSEDTSL
jgi:hypothetical protein